MSKIINDNKDDYFLLLKPKKNEIKKPLIITSPHSGLLLNDYLFKQRDFNNAHFDSMQDMHINKLSKGLENNGFTVLQSNISRLVIDLNRDIKEINPSNIDGAPLGINYNLSDKVNGGIGLIPDTNSNGIKIYKEKLLWSDVKYRINNYYLPWHSMLKVELENIKKEFGRGFILDLHSMPSETFLKNKLADFVIGNNFDKSSYRYPMTLLSKIIESYGYSVSYNDPYSGGHITKTYSSLDKNIQCMQIEIKKSLYMDEKNFLVKDDFDTFSSNLKDIIKEFFVEFDSKSIKKIAAE
ncbi:N-formylglutamate amidohydrolase [OCS116 cluster bacterium]|nr:N-formylglutamate amidohydrolase [OCS116 cluster bacterium]